MNAPGFSLAPTAAAVRAEVDDGHHGVRQRGRCDEGGWQADFYDHDIS